MSAARLTGWCCIHVGSNESYRGLWSGHIRGNSTHLYRTRGIHLKPKSLRRLWTCDAYSHLPCSLRRRWNSFISSTKRSRFLFRTWRNQRSSTSNK